MTEREWVHPSNLFRESSGAQIFKRCMSQSIMHRLQTIADRLLGNSAGYRVSNYELDWLFRNRSSLKTLASDLIGSPAFPVRAVFFQKNVCCNWITP